MNAATRAATRRRRAYARTGPTLDSLLNQASRQLTSDLRRVVSAEGLPVEFWRVLDVLADQRGRPMSELGEECGMQKSALSKLIDRMVDAALVQRSADPTDLRRVILHISDIGLEKVNALDADVRRQQAKIIGKTFSPQREAQLRKLLSEFIEAHQQASG